MVGVRGRGRRSLAWWRASQGVKFEARERRKCAAMQTIFFSENEIDLMPGACVGLIFRKDNVGGSNLYVYGGCHSCHGRGIYDASCSPSHPTRKAKRTK